jgi:hypothetical protein
MDAAGQALLFERTLEPEPDLRPSELPPEAFAVPFPVLFFAPFLAAPFFEPFAGALRCERTEARLSSSAAIRSGAAVGSTSAAG